MSDLRMRILDAADLPSELVDVPEWDAKVEIRGLTLAQLNEVVQRAAGQPSAVMQAEVVLASAYDPESGERVFDPADRDALMSRSGLAMSRLWRVAFKYSGLSDEAVVEAEADLDPTPSGG